MMMMMVMIPTQNSHHGDKEGRNKTNEHNLRRRM